MRERDWQAYERKYGRHPPACTCVVCEARRSGTKPPHRPSGGPVKRESPGRAHSKDCQCGVCRLLRSVGHDESEEELTRLTTEYKESVAEYEEAIADLLIEATPDVSPTVADEEDLAEEAMAHHDSPQRQQAIAGGEVAPVPESAPDPDDSAQQERLRLAAQKVREREQELEAKIARLQREAQSGETIWEREDRERIRKAKALLRRRTWPRRLRKGLLVAIVLVGLGFVGHAGYYMTQGLSVQQSVRAVGYDWAFYFENARGVFTPNDTSSEGDDEPQGGAIAATPTPVPTPSITPSPASTATPTEDEVNSAIDDYVNGRISRGEAVEVLGEARVSQLESTFPHLR